MKAACKRKVFEWSELPDWLTAYHFTSHVFACGLIKYVECTQDGWKLHSFDVKRESWSIECLLETDMEAMPFLINLN